MLRQNNSINLATCVRTSVSGSCHFGVQGFCALPLRELRRRFLQHEGIRSLALRERERVRCVCVLPYLTKNNVITSAAIVCYIKKTAAVVAFCRNAKK